MIKDIVIGKPSAAEAKKLIGNIGLTNVQIINFIGKIPKLGLNQPTPTRENKFESNIPGSINKDLPIVKPENYNLLGLSLGNPVFTNLTILGGSYTDGTGRVIEYPRIDFEAVLISVSKPRKIVKTDIQGRDGTVKEYIGEDDARISISGIIAGPNGHYPIDEVYQLNQVLKAPVALEVLSSYLQNLDIHSIVFEDSQLNQDEGGYSYQTFTLNAVSDVPQELRISGV